MDEPTRVPVSREHVRQRAIDSARNATAAIVLGAYEDGRVEFTAVGEVDNLPEEMAVIMIAISKSIDEVLNNSTDPGGSEEVAGE